MNAFRNFVRISLVVCTSTLPATGSAAAMLDGPCPVFDRDVLVKAVVKRLVDRGVQKRNDGVPEQDNPYAFLNVEDFLEKNPNCCSVIEEWFPEVLPKLKRYFKRDADDRIFYVKISFPTFTIENGNKKSFIFRSSELVTCKGRQVFEDNLR